MRCSAAFMTAALLLLAGCSSAPAPEAEKKSASPQQAGPAPETFKAKFETTKGDFVVEVTRAWSPHGADRFYRLVKDKFYDGARFFRVLPKFVVQFGINGDPKVEQLWNRQVIPDDSVKEHNVEGTITFATDGPNTRTTQVFINVANNRKLDARGFSPFGKVVEGMDVVHSFYSSYGEGPPLGAGPDQSLIETQGNEYLDSKFPRLDAIKKATVL